jgi:hypothetical protein
MEADGIRQNNTRRRRSRWTPLWVLCFAVVSVPLAVVMEGLTGMNSPGFIIQGLLWPAHGEPGDFGRVVVVGVALDSAFCFALLLGVYMWFAKRSDEEK